MPCKLANRSSQHAENDKKRKNPTPTTTHGDEEPDKDSPLSHFDFLREFRRLKSREHIFGYSGPLFLVSSLETLRMKLRFDEDAKRFLRLKLSRGETQAVRHAHEHPSDSTLKNIPKITHALNVIDSSSVSSINEALQYYCHLHKLQQMIDGMDDNDVKRDFGMFHQCFLQAFDVETSSA